jgi:hypothetical protein
MQETQSPKGASHSRRVVSAVVAGVTLVDALRHYSGGAARRDAMAGLGVTAITVGELAHGDAARALALSGALALITGLFLLIAGLVRLGLPAPNEIGLSSPWSGWTCRIQAAARERASHPARGFRPRGLARWFRPGTLSLVEPRRRRRVIVDREGRGGVLDRVMRAEGAVVGLRRVSRGNDREQKMPKDVQVVTRPVRQITIRTGRPWSTFRSDYERVVPHFDRLEAIGVVLSASGWEAIRRLSDHRRSTGS